MQPSSAPHRRHKVCLLVLILVLLPLSYFQFKEYLPKEEAKVRPWVPDRIGTTGMAGPTAEAGHWAFRAPTPVRVPDDVPEEWRANPIDALLAAHHRRLGLQPAGPMDPGRLLRRVTVDLTGLAPTSEELAAFLRDPSQRAYEAAVDRLLAGSRYGERWARHWMDVWRYSDEDGRLNERGEIRIVEWGSELLWRWRNWIINSLNRDKGYDRMILEMLAGDELDPESGDALVATGFIVRNHYAENREVFLSGLVEHASKAFMGLTLNCARCHDHRDDPVTQEEYYRLRAFFEPLGIREASPSGVWNTLLGAKVSHAVDMKPDLPTYLLERGDPGRPDHSRALTPDVPRVLQSVPIRQIPLPEGLRSTGRRLALARWLVDPGHPLTARVAVNHVWARHFGRGLVDNLNDFGRRSKTPPAQALLDWLALELTRNGWRFKPIHRLIVTSRAYRMASFEGTDVGKNLAIDPDNRHWWKYPARRMEAEVIRDTILHLAGRLDPRIGGPSEPVSAIETSRRRSLYFRTTRVGPPEFLCQFDPPSLEDCYERSVSIQPQQALALMNSEFVWRQAESIAEQLGEDAPGIVEGAFLLVLGRRPTAAEHAEAEAFLASQKSLVSSERTARTYLVHALLNHNDFITVR